LWEHEFKCPGRVRNLLEYWLHIANSQIEDFSFSDVVIRESSDYKDLLNKYHYLSGAGRGGIAYCAYLRDVVIGACLFSPLPRQNINVHGYRREDVRELSRFCIHPDYQKKNFASWFMARCIKMLPGKYRCILSYCDTTYNHYGSVYKACNFLLDSEVRPDYWYVSTDGWVMHKKTLYNHAKKLSMTEKEFARAHGYQKIYGRKKLRYIYERSL
jgi:GNAT superfamily N-acetyltransferase